eukprot:CAMPEP_0172682894 /NCGR_PEP_ID=MMETSP1074-20121228/18473_1 /TAXON_ID=2916 /ORGANISM="Ceratium fusus, Strain PA161109" /LENGTH=64 /DNA_ID=CAMNT_0013501651 /DNA_START=387 /DNA_END=581 /DNA_ORIENTATION=+
MICTKVVHRGDHILLPLRQWDSQQAPSAWAPLGGTKLLGVPRVHALKLTRLVNDAQEFVHLLRV